MICVFLLEGGGAGEVGVQMLFVDFFYCCWVCFVLFTSSITLGHF